MTLALVKSNLIYSFL